MRRHERLIVAVGTPSSLVRIHSTRITVAEPVTACYSTHVGINYRTNHYVRRLSLA